MRKVGHTSEFTFGIYWWTSKNPKNQIFEKMKKFAEDIIILHMMISNMRYSSWHTEWDRIFCHFRPFFNPLPSNNSENQNFEEMKKAFGDVILNLRNKKHDHMMYAYSDMECLHRHNFSSFRVIFCSFAPLLTAKIKIWKKCKKAPGDINLLYTCTINQDHMHHWYDVWFLRYEVQ